MMQWKEKSFTPSLQPDGTASQTVKFRKKSREGNGRGDVDDAELDELQLLQKAEAIHKDTTSTARRALKVAEECKVIQTHTLRALDSQNGKLRKADKEMQQVNEQLTYSKKLLKYMKRSCCCCMLGSCCAGTDPEQRREQKWMKGTKSQAKAVPGLYGSTSTGKGNAGMAKSGAQAAGRASDEEAPPVLPDYQGLDTDFGRGHEQLSRKMAAETRIQDQTFRQIDTAIDDLVHGAQLMNDKLSGENGVQALEHLEVQFDKAHSQMLTMKYKKS